MFGDEHDKCSFTESDGSYSDEIDSDVEAELYGLIHHEQNAEFSNETPNRNVLNVKDNSNQKYIPTSNQNLFEAKDNSNCKYTPTSNQNLFETKDNSNHKYTPTSNENLFETKDNSNHNYIPTSNQNLFETDDISFLQLYTSFETPKKSYYSSKSNSSASPMSSFSNRPDTSPDKCLVMNESNKRKRDLIDVCEEKDEKITLSSSKKNINFSINENLFASSDSNESVIIFEPSKDFTTNLTGHETVVLSSDDSSDSDSSSSRLSFVEPDVSFKASSPSINNNRNILDPWHINNEDLYRTARNSKSFNRYHNKMLQKCTNCNENGHTARSCSLPQNRKCFICGGQHLSNFCGKAICSKCYKTGHNSRRCWKVDEQYCELCTMNGHMKMNCPDIWRRYHLTTSNIKLTKGYPLKQDVPLYCFNCGDRGHFGSECPRPRMHSFEASYPTWPLVVTYSDYEKILSKERENSRGWMGKQHNSQLKQNDNKSRSKHNERMNHNENTSLEDQSISRKNNKERKLALKEGRKRRNKLKRIWKQQNGQKLVKEKCFPRSPKQSNCTTACERFKNNSQLPSSSQKSPADGFPTRYFFNSRAGRRKRKASLKFQNMNC